MSGNSLEEGSTPQFLFTDADFENNDFRPAAFVAKYRRATSLDSLRSQLRLYCQSLKDQLYNIINRDYKDFITIATKLEGVDHRVEYLRKPLIELRMDLTQLNDTMVSNLHAISDKIQQRREVSNRRRLLESSLACMTKLSNVEDVLNINNSTTSVPPSSAASNKSIPPTRPRTNSSCSSSSSNGSTPALSRRALIQQAVRTTPDADPERLELFQCSELERAAMALSEAHSHLREEKKTQQQQQQQGKDKEGTSHTPATVAMRRTLDLRAQSIHGALLARLQLCCQVLLTSTSTATTTKAINDGSGADAPGDGSSHGPPLFQTGTGGMSPCRRRSLGHLLRGLAVLDSGHVAETLVADLFTLPALQSMLTQGRVDGRQGRGSFSGLHECLSEVVRTVGERVSATLLLVEELFAHQCVQPSSNSSPLAMDLVVNGIWVPVLTTFKTNFAGMFSSGMANVFHQCYQATHQFIEELSGICGAEWKASIASRLASHKSYAEFKSLWKMDLHYQLRAQEIVSRLDKSLALTATHGLASQIFEDIYSPSSCTVVGKSDKNSKSSSGSEIKLSITMDDILQIEASSAANNLCTRPSNANNDAPSHVTWKLSLTRVFVIEILTCLHSKLFLKDLSSRMVALVIKILNCFNVHMLALIDHKGTVAGGGVGSNGHDLTPFSSPTHSHSHPQSPTPAVLSASKNTAPASSSGGVSVSATHTLSLQDLTYGISDVLQLAAWIQHSLVPVLQSTLFPCDTTIFLNEEDTEEEKIKYDRQKTLLKTCFEKQASAVLRLAPLIWNKMADILVVDCRSGLKAVKSVAGKFRMTNKPPPDTASAYVGSILKPLKSFLTKHQAHSDDGDGSSIGNDKDNALVASSSWKLGIVECVTTTYHQQIEELLATAQQMDTTLQRRSKMGKKPTPAGQSQSGDSSQQMSDSEKIALQILLDARAFGEDIKLVCDVLDPSAALEAYKLLLRTVEEAQTTIGK